MALLFMDSFDHYVTADLPEKYATVGTCTINPTLGRRGGGAVVAPGFSGFCTRALGPTSTTVIVGAAFKWTSSSSGDGYIFGIRSGTSNQATLSLSGGTGVMTARTGASNAAIIGTASQSLSVGLWTHIAIKVVIHPSTGSFEVRLNGNPTPVLNLTNVNTAGQGHTLWDNITFGDAYMELRWDDLYILDGAGPAPWNTFLGDCRVDARVPTAPGATTGWTPSTGANWACVDDAAPNDDTDYTTAAAAGLTDTFVVQDAPAAATIYGVQHCLAMKKTDAGVCTVAPVVRHGSTDYPGTAVAPATDYGYLLVPQATNPGTSAQWTEAGFNAAEFGYTRVS